MRVRLLLLLADTPIGEDRIRTCGAFEGPLGFQPSALNQALPPLHFVKKVSHMQRFPPDGTSFRDSWIRALLFSW